MSLFPAGEDGSTQTQFKPHTREQGQAEPGEQRQHYNTMASTPIFNQPGMQFLPRQTVSDDDFNSLQQYQSRQGQPVVPFVKSLLFKKDLQDQVGRVADLVRRELNAGQELLISARWLAVSKNWSTVAVCQECLDEIAILKDKLVDDSSVRLIQTASYLNSTAIYLSQNAMVVQFNQGVSRAKEFLTMEDDCAVMIPLVVPEGGFLSGWSRNFPEQRLNLGFSPASGFVMSGHTILNLDSVKPLVCLIFSMAAMKETSYTLYQVGPTSGSGHNPYGY